MSPIHLRLLLITALLLALGTAAAAWYPRLPDEGRLAPDALAPVLGEPHRYHIAPGDTLAQLGRAFGLGYHALARANPLVDPWLPQPGQTLILPYTTVIPAGLTPGITINLPEFRLYLLEEEGEGRRVRIYPIGIGTEEQATPEGEFRVLRKVVKPGWQVPASARAEDPSLPALVPPGPDNPLGDYWIEFSDQGHGIHGTNKPYGVGRRVSRGCVRLLPEDIRDLFGRVPVGTPVRIIYQPLKVGLRGGDLFLEAHPDYLQRYPDGPDRVMTLAREIGWQGVADQATIQQILAERRGLPLPIPAYGLQARTEVPVPQGPN